jgi:deoxyguanosine kinase
MEKRVEHEVRYIAIEGVIGAGKTSLTRLLHERLGGQLVLERFEENPFLSRFYQNPERYGFQTQLFFLLTRYKQLQALAQKELFAEYLLTDYIFEKDRIFAHLNLQDDELHLYDMLAANMEKNLAKPDLVVYLQSSVDRLMQNIRLRGRDFEKPFRANTFPISTTPTTIFSSDTRALPCLSSTPRKSTSSGMRITSTN